MTDQLRSVIDQHGPSRRASGRDGVRSPGAAGPPFPLVPRETMAAPPATGGPPEPARASAPPSGAAAARHARTGSGPGADWPLELRPATPAGSGGQRRPARHPDRQARHVGRGRSRGLPARPAGEGSGRDPFLDNVKLAAVMLVVVGHVLEPSVQQGAMRPLYFLIYSFHMPVFVLVAGYLSRRFTATAAQCRRLVTRLLVPYLVFQVLYAVTGDLVSGNPVRISLVTPEYLTWFLLSLATWRLLGPVMLQLRWPLLAAIGISLAVGLSDRVGATLSLSRTLSLLPFFVAGLLLRREHLVVLHRPGVRLAAVVPFLLTAGVCVWAAPQLSLHHVYWRHSYHQMDYTWTQGLAVRGAALLLAAALVAAFLALVPRRALPVTGLGENTMYAYLLHGLLVRPLKQADLLAWADTVAEQLGVVVLALLLGVALLTLPVRRAFRWLVEPDVSWALARQPAPQPGPEPSRPLVPSQPTATPQTRPLTVLLPEEPATTPPATTPATTTPGAASPATSFDGLLSGGHVSG